jgi:hypothetical protein
MQKVLAMRTSARIVLKALLPASRGPRVMLPAARVAQALTALVGVVGAHLVTQALTAILPQTAVVGVVGAQLVTQALTALVGVVGAHLVTQAFSALVGVANAHLVAMAQPVTPINPIATPYLIKGVVPKVDLEIDGMHTAFRGWMVNLPTSFIN